MRPMDDHGRGGATCIHVHNAPAAPGTGGDNTMTARSMLRANPPTPARTRERAQQMEADVERPGTGPTSWASMDDDLWIE